MKKKILFVGLGSIGQRHLRNVYNKYKEEAVYLAYREKNFARTISSDLITKKDTDITKEIPIIVYRDLKEALSQSPDVAFICNPTSLHLAVSLEIAKKGCDLFIEKPLSDSMDKVDELTNICERNKNIVAMGCQFRFHPCYILLKKLLNNHHIGNILSVHSEVGEYLPDYHKYEDYRHTYASRKDLGGGVVFTQIHEIDYLYDLFGLPRKVYAVGGHLSSLEIDVEDIADVLVEMNYKGKVLPVSLHMDYIQKPPVRSCKVIGELGTIIVDFLGLRAVIDKPDQEREIHDFPGNDRNNLFVDEIDNFFDCHEKRKQPVTPLIDGINGLKIALATKKSLSKRTTVTLE